MVMSLLCMFMSASICSVVLIRIRQEGIKELDGYNVHKKGDLLCRISVDIWVDPWKTEFFVDLYKHSDRLR